MRWNSALPRGLRAADMTERAPAGVDGSDGSDELPRMPMGRRLLLLLLAIATALTIFFMVIYRPGDPKRGMPRALPPQQQPCKPGQSSECVGGTAEVILVPASPSSAPTTAAPTSAPTSAPPSASPAR